MRWILLLALMALCAWAVRAQEPRHRHHRFQDTDQWVQRFEAPDRQIWQKPDLVVAMLDLAPGMAVADIGAGSGYFTRRLARAVAPQGPVLAVEIEPGFLEYIRRRAAREGQRNIGTLLARPDDPGLKPGSQDVVFICNTVHHFADPSAYLGRVRRALKPGGRLVIVDYFKERDIPAGPPPDLRLDDRLLETELRKLGFSVRAYREVLPYQYVLIGRKPG